MRVHLRVRLLASVLAGLSIGGCADTPAEPELAAKSIGIPPGWQGTLGTLDAYEIGIALSERHGGHSAGYLMGGAKLATPEVATLSQLIRVDDYRGKRLRLSAWVKGYGLVGPIAGLWMRVDGAGVVTAYDNMGTRPESGTTDWHEVSVVLDVPSNALGILIGAMLQGRGTLFIDDMKLESVGNSVSSTNMFDAPRANTIDPATTIAAYLKAGTSPTNIDFEGTP
ncbi:MAG: hypothetical protein V4550_10450 [Gemmatimonadota bacterium]